MSHWQDIRRLASLIEAEVEGRLVDRDQAVALARLLAERHPGIEASMNQVVARMRADEPRRA